MTVLHCHVLTGDGTGGESIYGGQFPGKFDFVCFLHMSHINRIYAYVKIKTQISCTVTIFSAFVFAPCTEQSLFFLNTKS